MKVFITGESGLIATALDLILENVVWGKTHRNDKYCTFNSTWNADDTELDVTNYELLRKCIIERDPDVIVHTAGYVGTDICKKYPKEATLSNVYGSYNIANICNELNKKLIYFSTTAVYDPNDYSGTLITEDTIKNPHTIYGITKYAGEMYCHNNVNNCLIIRPCFIYGSKDDNHSAIAQLIRSKINNNKCDVLLNGNIRKDYLYIDDFISALKTIIHSNITGEINVSGGVYIKFNNIISLIQNTIGNINYTLYPEQDYLGEHLVDNTKIKSFGWRPKISLEEGIQLTYNSMVGDI